MKKIHMTMNFFFMSEANKKRRVAVEKHSHSSL